MQVNCKHCKNFMTCPKTIQLEICLKNKNTK